MNRPQIEILIRIKSDLLVNTQQIKQGYTTREQYLNDFFATNADLQGIETDIYYPFVTELFNEYIY